MNVNLCQNIHSQERTKNAQFIIISLRSQMFELADRLVGIYKTYNATKSVTINPSKVAQAAAVTANSPSANACVTQVLTAAPVLAESKA